MSDLLSAANNPKHGIQEMVLNPKLLYPNLEERRQFEARFSEFLMVDDCLKTIQYEKGIITYKTESVIPSMTDARPPLLLLFGNPAPESVNNGCFFAGEKNRPEHRFWMGVRDAGVISFETLHDSRDRTQALFDLRYSSPFVSAWLFCIRCQVRRVIQNGVGFKDLGDCLALKLWRRLPSARDSAFWNW